MAFSSPHYLRLSLAAAIVLGVSPGRFYRDVKLGCINLLLTYPEGCLANCAYCGLARERRPDSDSFIRVGWPTLATEEVLERMARYKREVRRVCLSMVTHPQAYAHTRDLCRRILERMEAPLSVLATPHLLDREKLGELRGLGVDIIGIGLDAASERIFRRTRGRVVRGPLSWERYWNIIQASREIFGPFKVNAHLIVGLGESDRELVETFYRLKGMEVEGYLFSFYPEPGSLLERRRRPPLVRFRRLQLAKYLIEKKGIFREQMGFDSEGSLLRFDVPASLLEEAISSGEPFLTGGCPDGEGRLVCTRPFASYRPGEPFRDFPFPPEEGDIRRIRRELRLDFGGAS